MSVTKAFTLTADRVNSVVMSRAPGPAATGLIAAGQDLKGFYIKAKSCNWGPMAGFVCRLPPLNKSGVSGIGFNYEENLAYVGTAANLGYFYSVNEEDNVNKKDRVVSPRRSAWVPLAISDDRRQWLFAPMRPKQSESYLKAELCESETDVIYGVTHSADKTVALEYLLVKVKEQGGPWFLYHGDICYLRDGRSLSYLDWVPDQKQPTAGPDPQLMPSGPVLPTGAGPGLRGKSLRECRVKLDNFWQKAGLPANRGTRAGEWLPIHGIRNPFPVAYEPDARNPGQRVPKEGPGDAVVGDYDLFGVWPLSPPLTRELVRYTELGRDDLVPAPLSLFVPELGKALAVRSTVTRNIIIDCVPGLKERIPEAAGLGNVNSLVTLTAGILNSFAFYLPMFLDRYPPDLEPNPVAEKDTPKPNLAFHGDEGGRPDLWRVEMPVAVFIPPIEGVVAGMTVLRNALDLAKLIQGCAQRCIVTLNLGWVAYMFALCAGGPALAEVVKLAGEDPTRQPGSDCAEVLKESTSLMQAGQLFLLAELLARLFTPGATRDDPLFVQLVADSIEFIKSGGGGSAFPTAADRVKQLLSYRI